MRDHELHDYSQDRIDVWYGRIIRFAHAAERWLDRLRFAFCVFAGLLLGACAGAFIGAQFENIWEQAFWAGMIAGALLGGLGSWKISSRVFLQGGSTLTPIREHESALFALHLPGVQEQFARARKREFALFLVFVGIGVVLAYLLKAPPDWLVPSFATRDQQIYAVSGLLLLFVVLLGVNARCPSCRKQIGSLMRLRQCPKCGVAFRD